MVQLWNDYSGMGGLIDFKQKLLNRMDAWPTTWLRIKTTPMIFTFSKSNFERFISLECENRLKWNETDVSKSLVAINMTMNMFNGCDGIHSYFCMICVIIVIAKSVWWLLMVLSQFGTGASDANMVETVARAGFEWSSTVMFLPKIKPFVIFVFCICAPFLYAKYFYQQGTIKYPR